MYDIFLTFVILIDILKRIMKLEDVGSYSPMI